MNLELSIMSYIQRWASSTIDVDVNYNTKDKVDIISMDMCFSYGEIANFKYLFKHKENIHNSNNINFWLKNRS